MLMRYRWLSVLGLMLVGMVGCGPGTTSATGKVTFQGKPLPGGSLTLLAEDGVAYSSAISPDGGFTIAVMPTGTAKVGVLPPRGGNTGKPKLAERGAGGKADRPTRGGGAEAVALPEKFADPNASGVTVVISSAEPVTIDLK
ncbi:hypothetical protein [Tuwongella immobilis]|uniref:Carboxypeptidase regulatory-like domain-containing protein n=1 Tax=Tuwongella immobilis TaxID=692036 RepID=A0A6C2YIT6_9BACT|nr:hypothetical protein [Tuwongella immobilis]VIP01326.1 Uncharacterized protein OS=Planctomyces brasiliensis (strain ATCC 49424 / DSM 5305 / JCM 21570 / NBRC 103401 / IFAM 1448) GN=Plabr_4492 PE=4 SV=1 [Tuwongella immobilis]VTR98078.1 Uncharacterized protein OS=Planctomyces brasiliensis (strain ATCC 49424 / DSM 5305 / JCM 21570 / NBRC 103401 / IFAM 1448) GN=Plabr_4492 PE=4 SV=1 [Tuwongella immobilis]